ncbi:MAG TPA: peptide ABC transporter substrate-binding protein, partial [Rubrivivax sp.]|nr:peptide ABC transporter substrate-binding protein [Rubrivivax sp.]
LVPVLAAEIPSLENGGVARDGLSVTWKLKRGVTWHDGQPCTADDLIFNWEYARNPATSAVTLGNFRPIKAVEKIDSHSVRLVFEKPTPFWADAFVATLIVPRHHFAAYAGGKSRDAPANLAPVGTGPYRFALFHPGDLVRGALYDDYHMPNRPHFDSVEMKGGGDAVSAARAVIQTGEYDFGWNIQVEDEVLRRLERGGRGRAVFTPGGAVEYIMLNHADPWTDVDGERSNPSSRHPVLLDPAVRQALSLLVDRDSVQQYIYGRSGVTTANFLNNPPRFNSKNLTWSFDVEKANAALEAAGWRRGAGGVRAQGGRSLKFLFQTSTNAPRQKTQAIVKQAAQKAGIEMELKSVTAAVFFSSDVANPDTNARFQADLQMYTLTRTSPDPGRFMELFCSWEMPTQANKWQGRNIARWRNDDFDRAFRAAENELDPVRRAALFIRMNDLVCGDLAVLPLVYRPTVSAVANGLVAPMSGWANEMQLIHEWHRSG